MKNSIIVFALMTAFLNSAFCDSNPCQSSQARLNFDNFSRLLRDLSACPRGMVTANSLNQLVNGETLTLDGKMITRLGLRQMLANTETEAIKTDLEVILNMMDTPSDAELQTSLNVLHDWLQTTLTMR